MVDDWRDRIEKGQMLHASRLADAGRQRRRGQRPGRHDGHAGRGQRVDPFADDLDIGMTGQRAGHAARKDVPIHRQGGAGGHLGRLGLRHDDGIEPPHFLMQQPYGILVRIIGSETVGTDQFGQPLGLVRRGHIPRAAHFRQAHLHPRLRQLPRRFGPGQTAADDMHLILCH